MGPTKPQDNGDPQPTPPAIGAPPSEIAGLMIRAYQNPLVFPYVTRPAIKPVSLRVR